jgi:hypothetical protein
VTGNTPGHSWHFLPIFLFSFLYGLYAQCPFVKGFVCSCGCEIVKGSGGYFYNVAFDKRSTFRGTLLRRLDATLPFAYFLISFT